jgi:hypothetical protein
VRGPVTQAKSNQKHLPIVDLVQFKKNLQQTPRKTVLYAVLISVTRELLDRIRSACYQMPDYAFKESTTLALFILVHRMHPVGKLPSLI